MKAWLSIARDKLLAMSVSDVAAQLTAAQAERLATIELPQLRAWEEAARLLQAALSPDLYQDSRILFEYDLLRLDKRIDAILVTPRAVIVLEFKHGAQRYAPQDQRQVDDYAQDLLDFHSGCKTHPIIPLLVCTEAPDPSFALPFIAQTSLLPLCCNARCFTEFLNTIMMAVGKPAGPLAVEEWEHAPYRPVPSIIAAAERLYSSHGVDEIVARRSDAKNLTLTTDAIMRIITQTRERGGRSVIFVTGIPGAGKTLCGLNIAFRKDASFLSGNVPLVRVLREALARNAAIKSLTRLDDERHKTHGVLQNVHRFLEEGVTSGHAPPENVIVFDEAQRAWDIAQATKNTQRRTSHLSMSEPAHALEIMARAEGYAVIVALVGQGQEINTGEAGLAEWGRTIAANPEWRGFASPVVLDAAVPEQRLNHESWLTLDSDLHLSVPIRAIRSDVGAVWIEAVLYNDPTEAARIASGGNNLPYYLTRSLGEMRAALRKFCRGKRRSGLVASSGAKRLRAEGLGVQTTGVEDWFLNSWPDIRSSEALETFATEYDCQGLELDVVGLAWGGDMVRSATDWKMSEFSGTRWNRVGKLENQGFIRNTYRVLLTRARYETVIWVPPGSRVGTEFYDDTRDAAAMDAVAEYLIKCGIRSLS